MIVEEVTLSNGRKATRQQQESSSFAVLVTRSWGYNKTTDFSYIEWQCIDSDSDLFSVILNSECLLMLEKDVLSYIRHIYKILVLQHLGMWFLVMITLCDFWRVFGSAGYDYTFCN